MSVCATCLKPGLPADGEHDCPGLGDIQLTRQLGRGIRVDTAPARTRMTLTVFAEHGHGLAVQGADIVNIADQVLYQVVGYDPESAALVLELVEDWRPKRADATVCTPIPAATLMQMSEVPPELLTEQQLGRAENALERLRLAREALIRDGYFSADEVGPDVAPRIVEWLSHHRQQLEQARADARTLGASVQEWHDTAVRHQHWGQRRWNAWKSARARAQRLKAELDRLTAGKEPGWDPMLVPTPGQRLARAQGVIEAAETANRCHFEGHRQRLEEGRQAWVALARVRDVLVDMERITGARHWARVLRKAVDGEQQAPPEQLAATLREVLAAFATVTSPTSGATMGYQAPPIHPDDMARWRAALAPEPLTDADGRVICTCTHDTPCGCGTSSHYTTRKEATS